MRENPLLILEIFLCMLILDINKLVDFAIDSLNVRVPMKLTRQQFLSYKLYEYSGLGFIMWFCSIKYYKKGCFLFFCDYF